MSDVKTRIEKLRELMDRNNVDFYIVPTADFHQSEYVGEHFKARKFITGFTGSAGTAVIGKEEACLWTDGRYFIQAENQLKGSGIKLQKMGEPGVLTIEEYLEEYVKEGQCIGFDGRVVSMEEGETYQKIAEEKDGFVEFGMDLIDAIWEDRPQLSEEKVFTLDEKYAGESTKSKLVRIREVMAEKKAGYHILTSLEDICWMLNVRGNDVKFSPLLLSYAVITKERVHIYTDIAKFSDDIKHSLQADGVVFHPYHNVYNDIKEIPAGERVLVDPAHINFSIANSLNEGVEKVYAHNPSIIMKAMKNKVEVANTRIAEIKDSVCHVKFMKWLKENYNKMDITELSASAKLDSLREAQENYISPSFSPISAYGPHSACPHYESSPESDVKLEEGNLFLTDTGASFFEGSTDITRTYAIGEVPKEMKEHFTLVAMSNLRLANAKFLYGCTGMVLDILARQPLWDRGLDYNHGTGHGVGYLLNIHEGPAAFRWRYRPGETHTLEEGMIISDEPGIYIEGSHGIRLENEVLVCKGEQNEYGQFMYLEPITYIPFDLDAIDTSVMTEMDKELLNNYHKKVYEVVSPYLDDEEKEWLAEYTREI